MAVRVVGEVHEMREILERARRVLRPDGLTHAWACDFPDGGTIYFVLCGDGQESAARRRIYGASVPLMENGRPTAAGLRALAEGFGFLPLLWKEG